jgi:hypothetical protein
VRSTLGALFAQLPMFRRARRAPGRSPARVGDAELARRLQRLAERFDPDWQQPFAAVFGDVLGTQIANTVASALKQARSAGRNFAETTAEYLTEDRAMSVGRAELNAFHDDVDALRDDVERLRGARRAHAAWSGRMKSGLRALRIGRVLLRYRLDDLLRDTPAERWLRFMRPFVPRASREIAAPAARRAPAAGVAGTRADLRQVRTDSSPPAATWCRRTSPRS